MKYDFTTIMDRQGKDSIAVDTIPVEGAKVKEGVDTIPMWVADMNFPVVPSVTKAIVKRLEHPAFGYFDLPDEYYNSIFWWQETRNHVTGIQKKDIGYENGVVGGVVAAAQTFCSAGDNILVHSPTYIGFKFGLENNGYNLIKSELVLDEQGVYRMDYEDMDRKLKEYKIHLAVFCSTHNPCGRVWEKEEIAKAMEVYRANDCVVVSDEIWSDILLDGHTHIPTQSVSEDAKNRTIAFYAPSKTFNLAGLVGSYHIIYNSYLRDRIEKQSSLSHYNQANVLSVHGLIGAYSEEGAAWTDELKEVLSKNVKDTYDFFHNEIGGVEVARPEGTYMLFLDCSKWCKDHGMTLLELQKKGIYAGVIWQDGTLFGGDYTIRMNVALPHSRVMEALRRLKCEVFVD